MCIRDSELPIEELRETHLLPLASLLESIGAVSFELLVIGAVSYTHLRAHETVLDIVCRLLLEKKKK